MRTALLLTRLLLASADAQGALSLSTLFSQQLRWYVPHAHQGVITALAFSPDGLFLASGGHDGLVQIWETETGNLRHSFCHGFPVTQLHWSPNHLLASTSETTIQLWFVQPSIPIC